MAKDSIPLDPKRHPRSEHISDESMMKLLSKPGKPGV
jgi:hypothetical protein